MTNNRDKIREKRIKNLKPQKAGEPSINPNGRPKGILNFKTRLKMAIDVLAREYVKKENAKKENKNKQIKVEDVDILGDIFSQYLNKSRNGNERLLIHLIEMAYGKPKQGVEVSGALSGESLSEQEKRMEKAEKEMDKWEAGWVKKENNDNNKTDEGTKKENIEK